ncbi:Lipid transfer-like protein VAS [Apostasia shenzhenica]|uniref:Lipid transfer-like protein VAS n=1 Tax=Apostasia shenzhenica TaxID=1088818 RepID=A0A2I0AF44_9ASPA|nr:Lipid transfer-like protein VAS [Apostasia shenzhenica]
MWEVKEHVLHRAVTEPALRHIRCGKYGCILEEEGRNAEMGLWKMGISAWKKNAVAVVLMAVAVMAGAAAAQEANQTCVSKLIPCRDYLTSPNPPETCCSPLKDAVANDLPCLCAIFKSPQILKAFNVDLNQALKLPANCGIKSSTGLCNSTALSPSGSAAPPAAQGAGNGNNGASGPSRAGILGLVGLISILWIMLA